MKFYFYFSLNYFSLIKRISFILFSYFTISSLSSSIFCLCLTFSNYTFSDLECSVYFSRFSKFIWLFNYIISVFSFWIESLFSTISFCRSSFSLYLFPSSSANSCVSNTNFLFLSLYLSNYLDNSTIRFCSKDISMSNSDINLFIIVKWIENIITVRSLLRQLLV